MGGISVFMKDNCFVNSNFDEDEKAEKSRQFERGNVLDISQKISQVQQAEESFNEEHLTDKKFIESFNDHYISNSVQDLPILSEQMSIRTIE